MLLAEIRRGMRLKGIVANGNVSVIDVTMSGTEAATIAYRDAEGRLDERVVYKADEPNLEAVSSAGRWSFDGDGANLRLASEARRIRLAHLFDTLLAVHTSLIRPLPHQITAVYGEMLTRQPLRFLLADDPGAGKTIMAGLLIKELLTRGDVDRCLIICPGALVEQWQDELSQKFQIDFRILTNEGLETAHTGNWFEENPRAIARLDKLARDDVAREKLLRIDWDLVVVDEAHKMSASFFGNEVKYTRRYQLGSSVAESTRHFLLMTATPHSGKEEDFQLFMALLDPDRFEGKYREGVHTKNVSDLMRRMVKEDLVTFEGKPLFPDRRAHTVAFELSEAETDLYSQVTDYVREEFNRAEEILDGRHRGAVGFALTILQRRLASSPAAIYHSLQRRRERLTKRLEEIKAGEAARTDSWAASSSWLVEEVDDAWDEAPSEELEAAEDQIVDEATTAKTIAQFEVELATLARLERIAFDVKRMRTDKKWEELSNLLRDESMFDARNRRRKLVIFTEHRDTLAYLADRIRDLLGKQEAVVTIHGGMKREDRREAQELFTQDPSTHVLVATDAAGEGINLQRAHLMVNYDLPWNPNRIEQRFGRIHRIGQTEACHLWNLVARETREGDVYYRLLKKVELEREALGGAVFDVLGSIFEGKELRELLVEAIRYGDRPEVRNKLDTVVDSKLDRNRLVGLLKERALTQDAMPPEAVQQVREQMERAQAQRLQPHYIASFFMEAFKDLGGSIREREGRRFQITHVPAAIRNRARQLGNWQTVPKRYERVTFEKDSIQLAGKQQAEFVCPGHPLLDATINLTLERHGDLLKTGAVLVDPEDESSDNVRFLCFLEHTIRDNTIVPGGNAKVVSRQFQFVEIDSSGATRNAGPAPYLDYEPLSDDQLTSVNEVLQSDWLQQDLEAVARNYAIAKIVPDHLGRIRDQREALVKKTRAAVWERLTKEINYWDNRAQTLRAQEEAGKKPRLNSQRAAQRADELQARLDRRMDELDRELDLAAQPPVVVGGALIVPAGLLKSTEGEEAPDAAARAEVERRAMEAVMAAERDLGNEPRDVSAENRGYDIESRVQGENGPYRLRFIEVKGRRAGASTVTVTKNELLTALNQPEQFILAVVLVDGEETRVNYVRGPFEQSKLSGNYDLPKLLKLSSAPA